jgi:hypothetical protein
VEYSKQLNESRIKVLAAREEAVQGLLSEAFAQLAALSKDQAAYKRLITDLLVQVGGWVGGAGECVLGGGCVQGGALLGGWAVWAGRAGETPLLVEPPPLPLPACWPAMTGRPAR